MYFSLDDAGNPKYVRHDKLPTTPSFLGGLDRNAAKPTDLIVWDDPAQGNSGIIADIGRIFQKLDRDGSQSLDLNDFSGHSDARRLWTVLCQILSIPPASGSISYYDFATALKVLVMNPTGEATVVASLLQIWRQVVQQNAATFQARGTVKSYVAVLNIYARLGVKKLLELIDRYFHDIPEPLGAARARVAIAPPEGAGGYGVAILPLSSKLYQTMVDTFIEIDTAGNGNKSLDAGDFVNNPQLWAWLQSLLDKDHSGSIDHTEWVCGILGLAFNSERTTIAWGSTQPNSRPFFATDGCAATPLAYFKELTSASNNIVNQLVMNAKRSVGVGGAKARYQPPSAHAKGHVAVYGLHKIPPTALEDLCTAVRKHAKEVIKGSKSAFPPSRLGQAVYAHIDIDETKRATFPLTEKKMIVQFGEEVGEERWSRWVEPLISNFSDPEGTELSYDGYTLQLAELVLLADTSENGKGHDSMAALFDQVLSHSNELYTGLDNYLWDRIAGKPSGV